MLKSIIKSFLAFIYPPFCICCGNRVNTLSEKVCDSCWSGLQRIVDYRPSNKVYTDYLEDVLSCFVFDSTLQKIIHFMKYNKFKSLAYRLGIMAGEEIKNNLSWLMEYDFIVPIPLNPIKKRERGYNQSEIIANGISDSTGIPVNNKLLLREKYTVSQTNLDLHERRENVENAFKIARGKILMVNKKVILVDDVITTGATLNFAAKVVKEAGVEKVVGVAVASPLML